MLVEGRSYTCCPGKDCHKIAIRNFLAARRGKVPVGLLVLGFCAVPMVSSAQEAFLGWVMEGEGGEGIFIGEDVPGVVQI